MASVTVRIWLPLAMSCWAGCAAVSPRPETATIDDLPVHQPTPGEAQRAQELAALAVAEIVQRRYAEADAAAASALALDPRAARAIAVRAMVQLQLATDDPPPLMVQNTGERDLRLATALAPQDPFVGWMHALFLAELGHLSAAATTVEASLARCGEAPPKERAALLGLAGTYRYELGEERAALPHLQAYCALQPEDATNQFRLGSCLLRLADERLFSPTKAQQLAQRLQAEQAARAFAQCAKLAPGDEDAALAEVAALARAAELAAAEDSAAGERWLIAAEKAVAAGAARFPSTAEWPFRRGLLAEQRLGDGGDVGTAMAAYNDALQRDARHGGSLLNLAHLHLRRGERSAAEALMNRLLALDPARAGLGAAEVKRIRTWLDGGAAARDPAAPPAGSQTKQP